MGSEETMVCMVWICVGEGVWNARGIWRGVVKGRVQSRVVPSCRDMVLSVPAAQNTVVEKEAIVVGGCEEAGSVDSVGRDGNPHKEIGGEVDDLLGESVIDRWCGPVCPYRPPYRTRWRCGYRDDLALALAETLVLALVLALTLSLAPPVQPNRPPKADLWVPTTSGRVKRREKKGTEEKTQRRLVKREFEERGTAFSIYGMGSQQCQQTAESGLMIEWRNTIASRLIIAVTIGSGRGGASGDIGGRLPGMGGENRPLGSW